jgi:peptide subunit release factor 1 (eRF1)
METQNTTATQFNIMSKLNLLNKFNKDYLDEWESIKQLKHFSSLISCFITLIIPKYELDDAVKFLEKEIVLSGCIKARHHRLDYERVLTSLRDRLIFNRKLIEATDGIICMFGLDPEDESLIEEIWTAPKKITTFYYIANDEFAIDKIKQIYE